MSFDRLIFHAYCDAIETTEPYDAGSGESFDEYVKRTPWRTFAPGARHFWIIDGDGAHEVTQAEFEALGWRPS